MMTFFGSGPSAATIPSASRIAGNAKNTSITRPITRSARPARATGSRAIAASTPVRPRPNVVSALREADSGIQVAIQKIHKDVERHEEDRDREDSALNERVVALHDGGEQHSADTRHGEDLLDDDGTSEELTHLDPEQRDHHDEPVIQDVTTQHDRWAQALRPRRADVIS